MAILIACAPRPGWTHSWADRDLRGMQEHHGEHFNRIDLAGHDLRGGRYEDCRFERCDLPHLSVACSSAGCASERTLEAAQNSF